MKQELKSTKDDFKKLSEDDQARALCDDAAYFASDFLDKSFLTDAEKKEYERLCILINKEENTRDNMIKAIAILKKHPEIKDYQIIIDLGAAAYYYGIRLSSTDFVKEFILRPYYGTDKEKLITAEEPKHEQPKLELKQEQPKIELPKSESKPEPNHNNKVVEKNNERVRVKTNKGAARDMNSTITASDIVNACNAHSQQQKQQVQVVEHDSNCNCGHCKPQQPVVQQQQNTMSLDEKTKLLKEYIDFSPIKGIHVKEWEVDYLLQFLNSPILKQKLKEYNSACNPDYPKLTLCTKKYKFDKNLYKFAFWTPTNKAGQVLVILYNTNMTLVQNVGMVNQMGFITANESDVK